MAHPLPVIRQNIVMDVKVGDSITLRSKDGEVVHLRIEAKGGQQARVRIFANETTKVDRHRRNSVAEKMLG